jgi:hypothetical protein
MRLMWFLPFAFVAGVDGFALFAPYLILLLTVGHLLRKNPLVAAGRVSPASPADEAQDAMSFPVGSATA